MSKFDCLCGRSFSSQNALNGHKSHCKIYQIQKHGNLKNFKQAEINRHSKSIKTWKKKSKKYQNCKKEKQEKDLNNWIKKKHKCKRCGVIMVEKFGSGVYCSRSCANKRVYSKEKSERIRKKQSEYAKNNPSGFCSPDFRNFNRKNHSRRELEIVDYFKINFPLDEWKMGFIKNGLIDKYRLCPDLHSDKLKVVIEYDGIWHFKDIFGQLEKKQWVDNLILKWCILNKYRLIRIDEELKISINEIVAAVYNSNKKFEFFGSNRYDYLKQGLDYNE